MILYVKTGCPWCVDASRWLHRKEIPFEEIDVFQVPGAFEKMRQISGQSMAPTLELENGEVLADFDVGQLAPFLTTHGILPSSVARPS